MKWNKTKYKDKPTKFLAYQYYYIPERKIAGAKIIDFSQLSHIKDTPSVTKLY